ncbi:GIY-YIG nuclease family protein [Streptomyces sp. CAI-85]|uniref:GIY-YIG nuclease family protein n=1 Tax=Streptomyces sp. CAI-85 TaxID=1472662 RepID=UPI00158756E3|nr:GIY-YIG nuclease family protein [Streptomyces sp. CAI-85]NUV64290.1 hypothetical protein [Streptomyces sp. CAI-85]
MNTPLVYVITHPELAAVKVGQSSTRSARLAEFGRAGWQTYRTLHLPTVPLAYETEQRALFELRHRMHLPPYLTAEQLPAGWTETVSAGTAPPAIVWDIVCAEAGRILLGGGRPARRPSANRRRVERPLAEADLDAARKLHAANPKTFSTPAVARTLGRSKVYAQRVRDAVLAEQDADRNGGGR